MEEEEEEEEVISSSDLVVAKVSSDPEGFGKLEATLHRVHYGQAVYRFANDGHLYEFWDANLCQCGKDKCRSAKHKVTLATLVNVMDMSD